MSTYVVLDLEMCKVPKGLKRKFFPASRELIEIGAVALNENYEIVDTFMTYVRPEFGWIDREIQALTGITPAHVQNAPDTRSALEALAAWLPEDAVFVTWSENDVCQLDKELYLKGLDVPGLYDAMDYYIDCQEIFSDRMNTSKIYRLSEALTIADIYYDPAIHDALVDARNTAMLFAKVQTEETLTLSPYLIA
ncbi:MAG: exonuclease domain-containing protein [Clostridia bacterium]|nr:exonuclease domain-containing protein [Clostridia bacterium]